jgi:hypothetical protein
LYADGLLRPWLEALPQFDLFDCHTHIGSNDPSGFSATPEELLASLEFVDGRAAVFPLMEPEGYRKPNLRAIRLAHEHPDRLVAFGRVAPTDHPLERAEEALATGARGIKLHPASDAFAIDDPRLDAVYELAHERKLPMIVHAGPEIPGLGEAALERAKRYPNARQILAHDALSDLSWIWEHVEEHPNLLFDTSWWGPVHTMALFALIPPGRVLSASDVPYCSPLSGALTTIRCGMQAGLSEEQLALVLGGQFVRLLNGEESEEAGPRAGPPKAALDPLLERVFVTLLTGLESLKRGEDMGNAMSVTRHACKVREHHRHARVFRSVSTLLDLYEAHADDLETGNQYAPGWDLIAAAALIARTPDVPLPENP